MNSKFLFSLIFILLLASCGQSGPLYIPGDPSAVETPEPADDDDEENGDDDR